jgi:predicted PurR-regulated permease PerM
MAATESTLSTQSPPKLAWQVAAKRAAIWGFFLLTLYLARDFFFVAFMTFMFCYLVLAVVERCLRHVPGNHRHDWLRKLFTVGVFAGSLVLLLVGGGLLAPRLLEQGQRLGGWLSNVSAENEIARLLAGYVGPYEFRRVYGKPDDAHYQQGLQDFLKDGERHAKSYFEFSHLETWLEGGFANKFNDSQRALVRQQRAQDGTSSKDFEEWFLSEKLPELRKSLAARSTVHVPADSLEGLVHSAAPDRPTELLHEVRQHPAIMAELRREWVADPPRQELTDPASPAYREQFRAFFAQCKATHAKLLPYTFEQYLQLQGARRQGQHAFAEAWDQLEGAKPRTADSARADFEATREHELFQSWWATSAIAKFIRSQVESNGSADVDRIERIVAALLDIPVELGTALLLSLFICIDFPRLKLGTRRLRGTWLRDAHDEIAPALCGLSHLVGRSMQAQGLIALCNATMVCVALLLLGVEHELLLSGAVFVLCLVPTVGALCAGVVVMAVALLQPDGGVVLALKTSAAFVLVVMVESLVLGPRILGRMMELHPVMVIAVLPVAQYFFGVWGLILATPVAVYVLQVLILGNEVPGMRPQESIGESAPPPTPPPRAVTVPGTSGREPIPAPHIKLAPGLVVTPRRV